MYVNFSPRQSRIHRWMRSGRSRSCWPELAALIGRADQSTVAREYSLEYSLWIRNSRKYQKMNKTCKIYIWSFTTPKIANNIPLDSQKCVEHNGNKIYLCDHSKILSILKIHICVFCLYFNLWKLFLVDFSCKWKLMKLHIQ